MNSRSRGRGRNEALESSFFVHLAPVHDRCCHMEHEQLKLWTGGEMDQ